MDGQGIYEYAELDNSMDYLYEFFDKDLKDRLDIERQYIPEGLEDLIGDNSLLDYVWLWIKDTGPRGFRQYLFDGGYVEPEVTEAFLAKRQEWGMNTPPHLEWLAQDEFDEQSLKV
jgi:hypothetical protein